MTKSAKSKKAKKADFAKVKLKVGKKLKKAQNETRTDFRARKIILKEQLTQKTDDTLQTKKKHNIKELVSRLQYSNVFVRQDGINGMVELVKSKECSALLPHLSDMVPAVAPCIFDSDTLIRSTTIKFFEALIQKVGIHVEPYMNIVATHLSCAMVHLNMHVQGDSLKLMNVLVTHCPAVVARHSSTLLKNFINLISRKANNSNGGSKVVKNSGTVDFSRVLENNPNHNMASHKWRLKLLKELSAFMEAVLSEQDHVQHHIPLTTWQTVVMGSIPPISAYIGQPEVSKTQKQATLFSDPQELEAFVRTIVPLLFQIWAEVEPTTSDSSQGNGLLSEEGTETLSCIISIINQLWRTTQAITERTPSESKWFVDQLKTKYMSKIMRWFPCYCHVSAPKNKKKRPSNNNEDYGLRHCDDLNVSLAALALQLTPSQNFNHDAANFLAKLLLDENRDGHYRLSCVVDAVLVLLTPSQSTQVNSHQKQPAPSSLSTTSLIKAAHTCYTRLHPMKKDRSLLLNILLKATDFDNRSLWQCEMVEAWVGDLVKELSEGEVKEGLLEAAITLVLRGTTSIRQLINQKKDIIREHISSRGVHGWSEGQVKLKLNILLKDR